MKFRLLLPFVVVVCAVPGWLDAGWRAGVAREVITPKTPVWLAGYGSARVPDGKLHDLYMKAIALQDEAGHRAVLITSDFQGVPKSMSDRVFAQLTEKYNLPRTDVMFTFSHNHCGPRLGDDLIDYYPVESAQEKLVAEYTTDMVELTVKLVGAALADLAPVTLAQATGRCKFAVNRRDNVESEVPAILARGEPLKGAVDHDVPILKVTAADGLPLAILFGYACHPTTLSFLTWCGDYPGFAQIQLEETYPGVTAMFVNTCGGDQNPLPRRTVALCEKYGQMLADSVEQALTAELQPIQPQLSTSFKMIELEYLDPISDAQLERFTKDSSAIRARWAKRLLQQRAEGVQFADSYPYPLHAWQLGEEMLWIGMGAETVVDYSLRFKKEFGPGTWVMGYADDMIAYIPSRRVWGEGGYEGGARLYEYGRPALRWAGNIEENIANNIHEMVRQVRENR